MKDLFTEAQVTELANKLYEKRYEKMIGDFDTHFYDDIQDFLYEHYENATDKIKRNLLHNLCKEFIQDPENNKYSNLRQKLFQENKEMLTNILTDDAIKTSVDKAINHWTHKEHPFHWKYKEGIVNFIVDNKELFEDDTWINKSFLLKFNRQDDIIRQLKNEINELKEVQDEN